MAERKVEFTISAKDDFSATFGKAAKEIQQLRKELYLPAQGPLTRDDQLAENMAVHSVRRLGLQRARNDIYRLAEIQRPDFDFSGLRGQGDDITRLRGGLRPKTNAETAEEHEQRSLMQQSRTLRRGAKLFGAAAIAEGAAQLLRMPTEAVKKYEEMLKEGYSKGQAFNEAIGSAIPVIGNLAGAFRDVRQYVVDELLTDNGKNARRREEMEDVRNARQDVNDRRLSHRQSLLINARDVEEDAIARGAVAGRLGFSRDRWAVKADLQKKNKASERAIGLYGSFGSSEQQAEYRKQMQEGRTADQQEAEDKLAAINKAANAKREEDARSHFDRLKGFEDQTRTARLESEGKFLTSKLVAIREEANNELEDAKRRHHDDLLDPDKNPKLAEEQYSRDIEAIQKRRREKITDTNKIESREIQQVDREHKQKLLDADADFVGRKLRLAGKDREAERLSIKQEYEDRLFQIDEGLKRELLLHAERGPELRKQAAEDAEAAGRTFGITNEEADRRQSYRFRPQLPGGISGESHLLTGEAGAGGTQSVLLDPAIRSAKAAEESRNYQKLMSDNIDKLVVALTGAKSERIIR